MKLGNVIIVNLCKHGSNNNILCRKTGLKLKIVYLLHDKMMLYHKLLFLSFLYIYFKFYLHLIVNNSIFR